MKSLAFFQKVIAFSFVISGFMMSCDVAIELDLEQAPPQYVVEAKLVFDENLQPDDQYVRLTRSVGFYDNVAPPPVVGAEVKVMTGQETIAFAAHPNPDSAGYYFPVMPFEGQIDQAYALEIRVGDDLITATDPLDELKATFDSLTWEKDVEWEEFMQNNPDFFEDEDFSKVYQVFVYATVEKNIGLQNIQSYLFEFIINDTIQNNDGTSIYFADDQLIQENINGLPIDPYARLDDHVEVRVLSISRDVFVFYNDLFNNLNNDGGMFGPIPANLRTNLVGDALGVFQVSMVKKDAITVGQ